MRTVILLNHDGLGHGDAALGRRLLATFLRKSIVFRSLRAIVLVNAGVKLVAADSPVLAELGALHERGVELLPCGTCLEAFGVQPAVGPVSNMDEIIRVLDGAEKVITL